MVVWNYFITIGLEHGSSACPIGRWVCTFIIACSVVRRVVHFPNMQSVGVNAHCPALGTISRMFLSHLKVQQVFFTEKIFWLKAASRTEQIVQKKSKELYFSPLLDNLFCIHTVFIFMRCITLYLKEILLDFYLFLTITNLQRKRDLFL